MKFHQITMNFIPCFVFNNIERKVLDIFYFSRYTEPVSYTHLTLPTNSLV